jgi:translation elongation factor EF-Tu-like GTPase
MITGAANMDGAIVVVAASDGQMYDQFLVSSL